MVVVALRGELDVADAVRVVAELSAVTAYKRDIIVDLTELGLLTRTRLIDVFSVHASVDEAARRAGQPGRPATGTAPLAGRSGQP